MIFTSPGADKSPSSASTRLIPPLPPAGESAGAAASPSPPASLIEVLALWLGVCLGIGLATHLAPALGVPLLDQVFHFGALACMVLIPAELAARRGFDLDIFGLHLRDAAKAVKDALVALAIVLPPHGLAVALVAATMGAEPRWALPSDFPGLWASHLFLVALPEEFFYRGYVQARLTTLWPQTWFRVAGVGVGPALVGASLLFAVGHLPHSPDPTRLLVFFPGLLFGLLWARRRSLWGATLCHGLCNVWQAHLFALLGVDHAFGL